MTGIEEIAVTLVSYFLGCISAGYYLTMALAAIDIRDCGTGSTGARNVGRVLDKKGFIATLAGDVLKGAFAVWLAVIFGLQSWAVMLSVLAVLAGHIWPVQLGFRGGKGVAVTLGALSVLDWRLVAALALVFGAGFLLSRKYMASGLVAIIALPVMAGVLRHSAGGILGIIILVIVIVFAHRENIRGLVFDN